MTVFKTHLYLACVCVYFFLCISLFRWICSSDLHGFHSDFDHCWRSLFVDVHRYCSTFLKPSMFLHGFWQRWSLCLVQPSPRLDGMKDLLSSTWPPFQLLQSQTPHATFLEVTPFTCSGTRWREICHGQEWCLVSPSWQRGSGAQIRWLSIFIGSSRWDIPDWSGS